MKKPNYRTTVRNRILPYQYGSTVLPYGPIYRRGPGGKVNGKAITVRRLDTPTRHPRPSMGHRGIALTSLGKLTSQDLRKSLSDRGQGKSSNEPPPEGAGFMSSCSLSSLATKKRGEHSTLKTL
jgi:hypothetical protein